MLFLPSKRELMRLKQSQLLWMSALLGLALLSLCQGQEAAGAQFFDCTRFDTNLQDDEIALETVKAALMHESQQFDIKCVSASIRNNLFQTNQFLMNHYFYKQNYNYDELMEEVKAGISTINKKYDTFINKIHDELKKPVVMNPPFRWAQSLNSIEMEIKYAYRFDVAGCADLFNETVKIKKDTFYIGASCKELD